MSGIGSRASSRQFFRLRLSLLLFLCGLTLLWPSEKVNQAAPANSLPDDPSPSGPIRIDPSFLTSSSKSAIPIRIVIPSLGIDLPITPSEIKDGLWEVASNSASYGLGSAVPGQPGNIVVFAHARQGLFLPLKQISVGHAIYLLTGDKWHRYLATEIKTVKPNDVEVISPTSSETLTLYTCSGFGDSLRLVVHARPDS